MVLPALLAAMVSGAEGGVLLVVGGSQTIWLDRWVRDISCLHDPVH
jgi:hypothetical protein